jgi:YidC/Oxa1 family membrane protein insertase
MDKNTLIGFGLLILLLIGYVVYNQNAQTAYLKQKHDDSVKNAKLNPPKVVKVDSLKINSRDSLVLGDTSLVVNAPEQEFIVENKDIAITFSSKGARAKKVFLKNYKTSEGKPLILFEGDENFTDYSYLSNVGSRIHSRALDFNAALSADKKSITFYNPNLTIINSLAENGFILDNKVLLNNPNASSAASLEWSVLSLLTENDLQSQQQNTQVSYNLEKEGIDNYTISEKETKELKDNIKWLAFKQHYFNTTLIAEGKTVGAAKINSDLKVDTAKKTLSSFNALLTLNNPQTIEYKMYLGPNDYKALKALGNDLQEMMPLSYSIFGFVKYINLWLILPIWNFLSKMFSSYGLVILFLTFIIRLLMSPFTYKSYVSSAKMKALKPELDELRAKHKDDQQAFGVEQMKLYRQAGVNPLGGCLPALLQLPVFFALLAFFPQLIELRQSKFLWAKDLSTYDSILNFGFDIPFYGNHVSLFTILFVITSLILALYSMNMTPQDQSNPMMKYLPFIMPVMFLGIFNSLPASLTFYYFVSNVITLAIQFVIQQYIIDPDKIHAQIQAKKNEPAKENKFMTKMMEMQKQQQERAKQPGKKN